MLIFKFITILFYLTNVYCSDISMIDQLEKEQPREKYIAEIVKLTSRCLKKSVSELLTIYSIQRIHLNMNAKDNPISLSNDYRTILNTNMTLLELDLKKMHNDFSLGSLNIEKLWPGIFKRECYMNHIQENTTSIESMGGRCWMNQKRRS